MSPTSCSIWFPRGATRRDYPTPCPGSSCTISTAPNDPERPEPPMNYADASEKMRAYRRQIADIRRDMRATVAAVEPQEVADYEFKTPEGTTRLSELFGEHSELMLVHNMGTSCPASVLRPDGYNGLPQHVIARAALAVQSPDPPAVQQKFAASRGWNLRMVSHRETSFAADMGYRSAKGTWLPGIS